MNRRLIGLSFIFLIFGIIACQPGPPTNTPTPVAIIATATSPTSTPTNTPTATSENTPTLANPPAPATESTPTVIASMFGDIYGIEVVKVERVDSYMNTQRFPGFMVYPDPGEVFLNVGVVFYKDGVQLWDGDETLELSIEDSMGVVYPVENQDTILIDGFLDENNGFHPTNFSVYFSIPSTATGFILRYRDLPPIDLGQ